MKSIGPVLADEDRFGKRASVRKFGIMDTIIYHPIFDIFYFTNRLKEIDFPKVINLLEATNNQTNRGKREKS